MSLFGRLIDILRLGKNGSGEPENNVPDSLSVPKYIAGCDFIQYPDQSILVNDRYDFTQFSKHEAETIQHVWNTVEKKYPDSFKAMGFVNESYIIRYKARYILFEMVILMFEKSIRPIDKIAVAIAYESKGAHYRKQAIRNYESAIQVIDPEFLRDFSSYQPAHVFDSFSKVYEKEHEYQKAIDCTHFAKKFRFYDTPYYDQRIEQLTAKQTEDKPKSERRMPEWQKKEENEITEAAKYFIKYKNLPRYLDESYKQAIKEQNKVPKVDVERYAVMCNAYIEHQEEMEQYKKQCDN